MSILDDIKDDITDLQTLHLIATSFTDAAAARIKAIREAFERNQQFYIELSHVFHLVKLVALKKGLVPKQQDRVRTLSVAFTANQHFYGTIHRRIMETILKKVEKDGTDLLVVGKTGREYLEVAGKRHITMYQFDKDSPREEELSQFLDSVHEYGSILVYYPQFVSLVRQEVGVIDITQVLEIPDKTVDEETYILFEPEVDKILAFFEKQIRSVLFRRVALEAELARTAARMVSMNEASDRADSLIKEKHTEYLKLMRSFINRQLLDTFAGRSVWQK